MSTPFKFRHLDAIVGGFVIGAVAMVVGALLLVGHARNWFTSESTVSAQSDVFKDKVKIEFIEELSESLRPGTPVEFAGETVGKVASASFQDNSLVIQMKVADATLRRLKSDCEAIIKVPLAPFMGQTRVLLKPGHATDAYAWDRRDPPPEPVKIQEPRDTTAMAVAILKEVETNVGPLLSNLNKTIVETHALLADVRAQKLPEQASQVVAEVRAQHYPERITALMERADRIAAQVEALIGGLQAGHGIAGKVLADDKLAQEVAGMISDLRVLTTELRRMAPQVPGLARDAGATLDRADRLLDGVGHHWLLKDLVRPPEPGRVVPTGTVVPEKP